VSEWYDTSSSLGKLWAAAPTASPPPHLGVLRVLLLLASATTRLP
jgi:hypothetical protein